MFKSLKKWLSVPVTIKPFLCRDGAGDPLFDEPIVTKCYPQGKVTLVRDVHGNDIVSNLQLYFEGDTSIKVTDVIIFNGIDYNIKALGPYYDGNTGKVDIVVVYL